MKGIQNTSTENFSTILGNNKKFIVPKFQRDYSWDAEQWDDLWQDIELMISSHEEDHYMGYLVLQTNDDKTHYIIDGQQRMTTIMIIILAAMKNIEDFVRRGIEKEDNEKRLASIAALYIGKEDPVSLDYDNILVLNRHNNQYYKDYIVKLDTSMVRGLSVSEKLMKNCFNFYIEKLRGKFTSGKEYAGYIQTIADSLYFTKIVVSDELNAFRVFETLNARGVQLSSSDLLKNYLFSLVDYSGAHSSRVDVLEQKWSRLNDIVKTEHLPEFLRYYWNSRHKSIRSNAVFKTIRAYIKTDREVFELVDDMIRYSDVYMALTDKNDEMWGTDNELKKLIELLGVFRLKQPFSTLMSAKMCLSAGEFKRVLRDVVNVCFRYNVICDKNPNDQDAPFNALAISIYENHTADLSLLDKIYIEDSEFERTFAEKTFPYNSRNAKVIRYILGKIDHCNGSPSEVEPSDEDASIEHILPQEFSENWSFEESRASKFVDRLGNMCLLEKTLNREAQNYDFEAKVRVYGRSTYYSSNEICDRYSDTWNEDSIIRRQKQMAAVAKGIWRR
ncbi:MAG: DUF262 domain-containing HNH endonuclease family protein [Bacteroidales bacterium]|nr:DUF262 domain-containing HNH endonuclease family protein [Bacteroidales bacterium]